MSNGVLAAVLDHDHRRQASAKGIPKFKEAVWPHARDVGQNDAAAMELGENFLIDSCMLVGLAAIYDDQLVSEFAFDHRL